MDCLVEFDYIPQEEDELIIHKGDIIKNASLSEEGWLRGELNGKNGLFPDNFVKILGKTTNINQNNEMNTSTGSPVKLARVLHPYVASVKEELDLKLNTQVEILETGEAGWLKARVDGKVGWIPSSFVQMCSPSRTYYPSKEKQNTNTVQAIPLISEHLQKLKNLHSEITAAKLFDCDRPAHPSQTGIDINNEGPELALVKYPYRAANHDELSLEIGDVVIIVDKEGEDHGWWRGELNGKTGVFPDNFVEMLPRPMPVEKESGRYSSEAKGDKRNSEIPTPKQNVSNLSPDKDMNLSLISQEIQNAYLESLCVNTRLSAPQSHNGDQETGTQSETNNRNNYTDLVKFFHSNNAVQPLARPSSSNTQYESVTDKILKGLATAAKNASDGTGFTVYNTKSNTVRALDEKTLQALMTCIGNANKPDDRRVQSAGPESQQKYNSSALPPTYPQTKSCPSSNADAQDFAQKRKQQEIQHSQYRQLGFMSYNKCGGNQTVPIPSQRCPTNSMHRKGGNNNEEQKSPNFKSGDIGPTKPFVPNLAQNSGNSVKTSGMCSGDGPRFFLNAKVHSLDESGLHTDKLFLHNNSSKEELGCVDSRDDNEYTIPDQTNQIEESLTNVVLGDMRRQMRDLKKQMENIQESLVPRRDFELLRKEVENLRKVFTSRLQSILDEIDEEKKSRLSERLETSRFK